MMFFVLSSVVCFLIFDICILPSGLCFLKSVI